MSTGGSRGIRGSHDYVRQGGAAARRCCCRPPPTQWKVPVAELTVDKGVITHEASKRTTTYGKVAAAAAKLPVARSQDHQAQGPEGLEDRRQAAEAPRHRRQADRQAGLRHRRQAARHADRVDHGRARVRRQGQELRRGQGQGDARREATSAGRRHGRRRGRRHLVAGQARRSRRSTSTGRRAPTTRSRARPSPPSCKRGARPPRTACSSATRPATPTRRSPARPRRSRPSTTTPYRHHVTMEPMNCTAKWTPDKCEVWVATQNGEASLAACAEAAGLPPSQVRGLQAPPRRRLRPARLPGLHHQGRAARQADPGRAGEDDLDARGGHAPGPLPAHRACARWTAGLDDKGNLVGFKMRISAPSILASAFPQRLGQDGMDPIAFQGLNPQAAPKASSATPSPTS